MKVISITPRGFCYGVVDAMEMVKRVATDPKTPRPIYILGQLVHHGRAPEPVWRNIAREHCQPS
jgi:4-hydroxy-3-methylbut-2-enyl diphosphate reductase